MIDEIQEKQLKKFAVHRDKVLGVGKRQLDQVWMHKSYTDLVMPQAELDKGIAVLPEGFTFDIVRFSNNGDLGFISSPDFDVSNEPIVSLAFKVVKGDDGEYSLGRKTKERPVPQIYHHKWLMVDDNYQGFDVDKSKERSMWKIVLGVNREVSSRIGTSAYWDSWLNSVGLEGRDGSAPEAPAVSTLSSEQFEVAKVSAKPSKSTSEETHEAATPAVKRSSPKPR